MSQLGFIQNVHDDIWDLQAKSINLSSSDKLTTVNSPLTDTSTRRMPDVGICRFSVILLKLNYV